MKPFSYPRFRLFWASSLASTMPFLIGMAARGWLILEMRDSPFLVAAVQGVLMLPMALLTPIGGVIADRLNRKMVLLAGEAANLLILLVLTVLILFEAVQVWHVFLLAFLNGAAFSMSQPTKAVVVHDVVAREDVAKGVAIYTTVFSVSQFAGPALAGYLMDSFYSGADLTTKGLGWTFLAAAAFHIPAFVLLLFLRFPDRVSPADGTVRPSVLESIGEGLTYVRGKSLLVGFLLLSMVIAIFGIPYQTLLPVFARDILHAGPDGLGLLLAAGGGGAIVGSFVVAFFTKPRQLQALILGSGFAFGLAVILFAHSPYFSTSLLLSLFLGLVMQVFGVGIFAVIQVSAPAHIRGRVIGTLMLAWGFGPAGMFLLGFGAEVLDPEIALTIMGTICIALIGVLTLVIPAVRHVERELGERGAVPLAQALAPEPAVSAEDD